MAGTDVSSKVSIQENKSSPTLKNIISSWFPTASSFGVCFSFQAKVMLFSGWSHLSKNNSCVRWCCHGHILLRIAPSEKLSELCRDLIICSGSSHWWIATVKLKAWRPIVPPTKSCFLPLPFTDVTPHKSFVLVCQFLKLEFSDFKKTACPKELFLSDDQIISFSLEFFERKSTAFQYVHQMYYRDEDSTSLWGISICIYSLSPVLSKTLDKLCLNKKHDISWSLLILMPEFDERENKFLFFHVNVLKMFEISYPNYLCLSSF